MAETYQRSMTAEEFLDWQLGQEDRYELIDGYPIKLMTGATDYHDRVVTNIIAALHAQLRGKHCRVATADLAVHTRIRGFRRSDVVVTCGQMTGDSTVAEDPRLVVEVLSKSNTGIDWQRKLDEYRHLKGLAYILLVDSRLQAATLYVRSGTTWEPEDADDIEHVLKLPAIDCTLALADIYDGLTLPRPEPSERA